MQRQRIRLAPDVDHKTAGLVLVTVVGACVSLSAGVGIRAAIRAKRHATKISIVQTLLACALSALVIALAHVILGGRLPESERSGLWNDGTLIVFPTSMAGLGASVTSLWAVLWTAEAATRQRYAQTVAERQRDATQLLRGLNQLSELTREIYSDWFLTPQAPKAMEFRIQQAWERILDDVAGSANIQQDGEPPGGEPCLGPCRIHLPHSNAYFPEEDFGSTEGSGCSHFLRALERELPDLYTFARRLAATHRSRMLWVHDAMRDLAPLLLKLQLDQKPLLADVLLFQEIYPRKVSEADTSEGRWALAAGLEWSHVAMSDSAWESRYRDRARRAGVVIIDSSLDATRRDLRLARGAPATRSLFRQVARDLLAGHDRRTVSDAEFWSAVSAAATPSPDHQSSDE